MKKLIMTLAITLVSFNLMAKDLKCSVNYSPDNQYHALVKEFIIPNIFTTIDKKSASNKISINGIDGRLEPYKYELTLSSRVLNKNNSLEILKLNVSEDARAGLEVSFYLSKNKNNKFVIVGNYNTGDLQEDISCSIAN